VVEWVIEKVKDDQKIILRPQCVDHRAETIPVYWIYSTKTHTKQNAAGNTVN